MPLVKRIEGTTRTLGKSQGYTSLPIRDEKASVNLPDGTIIKTNVMISSWEFTLEEVKKIVNGAPLLLYIYGTNHPPVRFELGEEMEKIV